MPNDKTDKPTITLGEVIPLMKQPVIGTKRGNKVITVVNALLRIQILGLQGVTVSIGKSGGLVIDFTKAQLSGGTGSGIFFAGEFIEGNTYLKNALVVVRGVTNAGAYLALQDTEELPWDSAKWVQIADNTQLGRWLN